MTVAQIIRHWQRALGLQVGEAHPYEHRSGRSPDEHIRSTGDHGRPVIYHTQDGRELREVA